MERIKVWYLGLAQRERMLVASAGALLVLAITYLVLFGPAAKALNTRQARVVDKRQDLVWMRSVANAVRMAAVSHGGPSGGESLVVLINRTAQQAGIASALNNQAPQGDNGIRVRLENVQFDLLVTWLGQLERQFAVRVDNANIERTDKTGYVNASLVLSRGAH